MRQRAIGIIATVAASAATIAALSAAPVAVAYPGDPNPGCESGGFMNATLFCDGPIRPDGTWQRCWQWQANYVPGVGGNPGGYSPGGNMCAVISEDNIQPAISPRYHIGD
nr:hypothetical protein [Mycobacterium sp. UM_NZ2]